MEKVELNINNIFNELAKLHAALTDEDFKKDLFLLCNYNTLNIYKSAYGLNFGYSLPTDLNYMGIKFLAWNFSPDNYIEVISNPYWNQTIIENK